MVIIADIMVTIFSWIFETVFIFFFIKKSKKLKNKNLLLITSILISYILSALITGFNYNLHIWFYVIFNIFSFIFLKLIYKENIYLVDFFIIGYAGFILTTINIINIEFITLTIGQTDLSYYICFISILISILMVMIFLKNKLASLYNGYIRLWNRRDNDEIKAITVRNMSLIFMNIGLYLINILLNMIIL